MKKLTPLLVAGALALGVTVPAVSQAYPLGNGRTNLAAVHCGLYIHAARGMGGVVYTWGQWECH